MMAKKDGFSAIIGLTFWKGCLYKSGRKERKPMIKVPVNFQRTEDAVEFVKIVNQYPFQMDLISGTSRRSYRGMDFPYTTVRDTKTICEGIRVPE